MSESLSDRNERLYRVKVRGGGSFVYDIYDVTRFCQAMVKAEDNRAVSIRPMRRFLGRYW